MAADWDPTEFQAAIFEWLDRTGMSQKEAADLSGVSQGAFNRWLQPDRRYLTKPSPETLEKLAPHIRISYDELMRMTGRRSPKPVTTKNPADLEALIKHLEEAWPHVEPAHKSFGSEMVRNLFPLHKRTRKPRQGRNTDTPDEPRLGLLTHGSMVLSAV